MHFNFFRNLNLPSLDNVKTSKEQDDLMDKIIDEMSLVKFKYGYYYIKILNIFLNFHTF